MKYYDQYEQLRTALRLIDDASGSRVFDSASTSFSARDQLGAAVSSASRLAEVEPALDHLREASSLGEASTGLAAKIHETGWEASQMMSEVGRWEEALELAPPLALDESAGLRLDPHVDASLSSFELKSVVPSEVLEVSRLATSLDFAFDGGEVARQLLEMSSRSYLHLESADLLWARIRDTADHARRIEIETADALGALAPFKAQLPSLDSLARCTEEYLAAYLALPDLDQYRGTGGTLSDAIHLVVRNHASTFEHFIFRPSPAERNREPARDEPVPVEEGEQAQLHLVGLLMELCPDLVPTWRGVAFGDQSDNPDQVRHVSASYRELLLAILRRAAPDDEIRAWTTSADHYLQDGKTIRHRARFEFLCSLANQGGVAGFVKKELTLGGKLIYLTNKGVHEAPSTLSNHELARLKRRVDSLLAVVLYVWKLAATLD